jgi:hypothetical protein
MATFSSLSTGGFIITEKRSSQPPRSALSRLVWPSRKSLGRKQGRFAFHSGFSSSGSHHTH